MYGMPSCSCSLRTRFGRLHMEPGFFGSMCMLSSSQLSSAHSATACRTPMRCSMYCGWATRRSAKCSQGVNGSQLMRSVKYRMWTLQPTNASAQPATRCQAGPKWPLLPEFKICTDVADVAVHGMHKQHLRSYTKVHREVSRCSKSNGTGHSRQLHQSFNKPYATHISKHIDEH